jgi:DNA-binding IclR family transcriptional regulator
MSRHAPSQRRRSGVQVIQRAGAILRALEGHPEGLSLSEIATRVRLPRSTVHRLVTALEEERFIAAVSPNGHVKLGRGLASLALAAAPDLAREIHPYLARLSRQINETVDMSVLHHDHVLFVDQVAAPRRLRAVSAIGATFPAHCPANGKVLLSTLSSEQLVAMLPKRLERLTPNTITDRDALLAELETTRADGVAYDREEHTIGICGVGGLVRDATGRVVSVSVPLPTQRFHGSEQTLADTLLETCEEITTALLAL